MTQLLVDPFTRGINMFIHFVSVQANSITHFPETEHSAVHGGPNASVSKGEAHKVQCPPINIHAVAQIYSYMGASIILLLRLDFTA